jgi:hypothetical protein
MGICILHFPLNPMLNFIGGENGFCCFFFFPSLYLVLLSYFLNRLVSGFDPLILFLCCSCFGF